MALYADKSRFASVKLTPEQETEIQSLWETHYGQKINLDWHRFYQSFLHNSVGGGYDKHYFPENIFRDKLLWALTPNRSCVSAYGHKGMEEYFLHNSNVTVPETLLVNASGYFYNGRREVIPEEEAARILISCGKIVAKPTDSTFGRNVRFYDSADGNANGQPGQSLLKTILDTYRMDFIVQRQIEQHETLSRIHASSVNMIRIITYILEGNVHAAPLLLRVGQGNRRVDNLNAGGIGIGVSDDGLLAKVGFTYKQDICYQHPDSGVVFEGYRIPRVREMVEAAKKLHGRILHAGFVAWDMTLGTDGNIVVVEFNVEIPGISVQCHGKSIFGDNTPKMIALCRKKNRISGSPDRSAT